MDERQMVTIGIVIVFFALFLILVNVLDNKSINGIKAKQVGDGQHGTARWATKQEIRRSFSSLPFAPSEWRQGKNLPNLEGTVVACRGTTNTTALIDTGDVHTLMIGAAGVGKTAYFLYPNIEFACASGMSFLSTDTKGDVARNYGEIASKYYGYHVSVLDLRNPTRSDENNILHMVNKYMDEYLEDKTNLSAKAKAEKYAKITAKTIINIGSSDGNYGQNAFFYDAAEGLLSSTILLVAEFGDKNERHIVTVFKLIQDLIAKKPAKTSKEKTQMYFAELMEMLPSEHKAKWLAGAALNSSDQAMLSVMSTALSRLNSFLDSEMEQILCFGTAIDAEKFCSEKCAVFVILPEEDQSKYFILDEIEYVSDAIRGIHIELQNDRIALAESTRDKLLLASKIQDAKLREVALLNVVNSATEAKRVLMRNFTENLRFITENSQKNDVQLLIEGKKGRDIPQRAADAFQALVSITNSVQIECQGYALLGEYEVSKESLLQFRQFIIDNKLDDRDTLLLLNENTPLKKMTVVNEFGKIVHNITAFDASKQISGYNINMIAEVSEDESEEE